MMAKKRDYKTGGLRERSSGSWELKVRCADPRTGRRVVKFYTVKGSKQDAKKRLRDLSVMAEACSLPDEQKLFGAVLDSWESSLDVSPKTAERYLELVRLYIRPHLGGLKVRAITASRLEEFYGDLRAGRSVAGAEATKLAPRTIGHIHRLVVQALGLAERDKVIEASPARHAKRPKIERTEIEILAEEQIRAVLAKLRGRAMYLIALTGLATGMRRGELLALRWKDVDLDAGKLKVEQSLEQTKSGLRFKAPKTRYGRRIITLPFSVTAELRLHRKTQAEQRLKLGLGKPADDALVFQRPDGEPLLPNSVTTEWRRLVTSLKLPKVSLHSWRHTHASQLIASGLDVLTISRRLGHGSPSITLDVYSHLFKPTDTAAAAVFESAFGKGLSAENNGTEGEQVGNEIGGKLAADVVPLH
jgi:integrase